VAALDPLYRSITRDEVNALPVRRYEGEVLLVADREALERAMDDLRGERVAGIDTETRPAFRPGESYPPSLVQVASARAVYLFQLQRMDFSAALREMLASETLVKVGVSVADDLRNLKSVFEFGEKAVLDLGTVAKRCGCRQAGVRTLAALFLGFRIPKGTKTSNWARRELTAQQVAYAATDAWACRELYLAFEKLDLLSAQTGKSGTDHVFPGGVLRNPIADD
jgi:ribonuclease D